MVSEDTTETVKWANLPNGHSARFRTVGDKMQVLIESPESQTLEPGMTTPCGPAMRAAIMERAKELGLATRGVDLDTYDLWGIGVCHDGVIATTFDCWKERIPTHEFLRRMENYKPPKKELTTEERLAEAVRLLDRVTTGHENLMKACGHYTMPEDFTHTGAARAFLKSIKP